MVCCCRTDMTPLATLLVALFLSLIEKTLAYRPVIVLHGIFASDSNMDSFVNKIKDAYPGIEVSTLTLHNGRRIVVFWRFYSAC